MFTKESRGLIWGGVVLAIVCIGIALSITYPVNAGANKMPLLAPPAPYTLATIFTYEGMLEDGGGPVTDDCDFQFSLFDDPAAGTQIGSTLTETSVSVVAGLFSVELDFGESIFTGVDRWMSIAVRCPTGSGVYDALFPRQAITAAPMAMALPGLYTQPNATSSNVIGGLSTNTIQNGVYGGVIAGGGISGGENRIYDHYGTIGGGSNNQTGSDDGDIADDTFGAISGGNHNLAGYFGAISGGNDNRAGSYSSVGGGGYNDAGPAFATISGGGSDLDDGNGNQVFDQFGTIGGGRGNRAGSDDDFHVGDQYPTVGGGVNNQAVASGSTVGGGVRNIAGGGQSVVAGGIDNLASNDWSTVGGGNSNTASGSRATVSGGGSNLASNTYSTIGGGYGNTASGESSSIGGGSENLADGGFSTIGGGDNNTASGFRSTIAGGDGNSTVQDYTTVGGGISNQATNVRATVCGGQDNIASGERATVGGGVDNTASGADATVSGGNMNTASGDWATVGGGGNSNLASDEYSTVGGGSGNTASGDTSTVAGGVYNIADGDMSAIGGGANNTALGFRSTVPGGNSNSADANYSFAAGSNAKVQPEHWGALLFSDGLSTDFSSITGYEFAVRATGGFRLVTAIDGSGNPTAGMVLPPGTSAWEPYPVPSDVNLKREFAAIDGTTILNQLQEIPVTEWGYEYEDPSVRHMGPMAQDFYAAFGLGQDERHIQSVDADGVAFAAIQGMYKRLQEKESQIERLEQRNSELETRVTALEELMKGGSNDVGRSQNEIGVWMIAPMMLLGIVLIRSRKEGGDQ